MIIGKTIINDSTNIGEEAAMKKRLNFATFFGLILILIVGSCGKKDSGGKAAGGKEPGGDVLGEVVAVVSASGAQAEAARILRTGEQSWEKARTGSKLAKGDRIAVQDQGNAMIRLQGGEQVALNSGTVLTLTAPAAMSLEKGELWIDTSLAEGAEKLSVKTGQGDVTIEGTIADLRVAEKVLRVSVISGKAKIVGEKGEIEIHGGQEAQVEPQQDFSVEPVKDPGMLAAWTEAVRREIRRTLSKEGEERLEVPRGLGTLTARVPGGKKDLPFEIVSQDVTVKIQDQVALTRVEQVFKNPTKSTVEGTYKFPIPYGARMNRFDMQIKGRMMPGEIVERQKGRAIMQAVIKEFYERMRDPALVEWESGSTFKTRIFPILPGEKKRIVLSYIQTLDGEGGRYRYVLPVSTPGAAAPVIPDVKIEAEVSSSSGSPLVSTPLYPAGTRAEAGKVTIGFEAKDFSPVVDFVIDVDHEKSPEAGLVTYGGKSLESEEARQLLGKKEAAGEEEKWNYFMLSMKPEFAAAAEKPDEVQRWIFLVDTSQSRTMVDMEVQKKLLEALVGNLSREDRVKVIAFDSDVRSMKEDWEIPSRHLVEDMDALLGALPAAGATNIEGALMEAARQMAGTRGARIVLVGDGAATLGENRAVELAKWAGDVFNESRTSITTVGVGSSVDNLMLEELAGRTGGKFYYLSTGEDLVTSAVKLIGSLRTPILREAKISFEGLEVKDVYPEKLPNVSSGQEIVVTGLYRGTGKLDVALAGIAGTKESKRTWSFNVGEGKKGNSFVPVIWASRKIDALTLRADKASEKEVVRLSKRYSLPSRYTSFIVLETEEMYKEFGVQRDKDRIEWQGEEGVEYEEALGNEQELQDEDVGKRAGGGAAGFDSLSDVVSAGALGSAEAKATQAPPMEKMEKEAPKAKAGASMKGAPATAAPAKKAKKSMEVSKPKSMDIKPSFVGEPDYYGGGGGYSHYYPPPPRQTAAIKALPVQIDGDKRRKMAGEMKQAIEKDPLVRNNRSRYIRFLMSIGDYKTALEEAAQWYAMDSGNPTVMILMGDLMRFKGDTSSAMRFYSGVLDVSPEQTKLMENLAGYLESRGRWEEAYAYRVSMNLVKRSDKKAAAARAIAAARVGRWDDADRTARDLLAVGKDGKLKLKPGVSLPSGTADLLVKVAQGEKSPLLFEQEGKGSPKSAKLLVELTWDKAVDLDVWILDKKGDFLGGGGDRGRVISGKSGSEGEVFYMAKLKDGRYKVQVVCADERGCGTLSGKVSIKALGKSQAIPFVIEDGWGSDVAQITVKTEYPYYKYGIYE
jgi:hypothetical protein